MNTELPSFEPDSVETNSEALDPSALVVAAEKSFQSGDQDAAMQLLKNALRVKPEDFDLLMCLGNFQYHTKDLPGAVASFTSAAKQRPDAVLPHLSRALALVEQGDFLESEGVVRQALAIDPANLNGQRLLYCLLLRQRRFADVLALCRQILERDPQDINTWLTAGRCHFELKDNAAAAQMFEKVLALDPNHAVATENLMVLRSQQGIALSKADDPETILQRKFEKLGPWCTRFKIQGKECGGTMSYDGDLRLKDFFEWFTGVGSVLELGSFEGAHSFAITENPRIQSLIGLEGRDYLVARANFIKELISNTKVRFFQCDFEKEDISRFGPVDVVFCAGLLYHLSHPWMLIESISKVAPRLFLSTHYAEKEDVSRLHYKGILFKEGTYADPLSGLVDASFWPTFKHLSMMLTDYGFRISKMKDYPSWVNAPLINLYCER